MSRTSHYSFVCRLVIDASPGQHEKQGAIKALYRIAKGEVPDPALSSRIDWEMQAAAEDALRTLGKDAEPYVVELERAREW